MAVVVPEKHDAVKQDPDGIGNEVARTLANGLASQPEIVRLRAKSFRGFP
jgi:hypothetical protein